FQTEAHESFGECRGSGIGTGRARHYARHDFVTAHIVGNCRHTNTDDLGVLQQDTLDLNRRYVLSTSANDVLLAIHEVEVPVLIEPDDVAGVKIASCPSLRGRLSILEVLTEESVARQWACGSHEQLSRLACRHSLSTVIDNQALDA